MDTISFGIDVSRVQQPNAAASNRFYESAASPSALASVIRNNVLIRDVRQPFQVPFDIQEWTPNGE